MNVMRSVHESRVDDDSGDWGPLRLQSSCCQTEMVERNKGGFLPLCATEAEGANAHVTCFWGWVDTFPVPVTGTTSFLSIRDDREGTGADRVAGVRGLEFTGH